MGKQDAMGRISQSASCERPGREFSQGSIGPVRDLAAKPGRAITLSNHFMHAMGFLPEDVRLGASHPRVKE